MSRAARRLVVKVGGSLLTRPGVPAALAELRRREPIVATAAKRVWIVGGGGAVDAIRRIDQANPLPEAISHAAAVGVMDLHARLLAAWAPWATLTDDWRRVAAAPAGDWTLAVGRLLARDEPSLPGVRLPIGWRVTSDSIAARVAEILEADLLLLKSAELPHEASRGAEVDWRAAAEAGYVDKWFPHAAAGVARVDTLVLPGGERATEEPPNFG